MKIENISNFEIIPKIALKRNDGSNSLSVSVKALAASDSLKFSKVASQKAPEKPAAKKEPELSNLKLKLSGLGEKLVNQPILNHYLSYRNDEKYRPVIAKVDLAIINGAGIKDLEKVAIESTRENNKDKNPSEVLAMAYRSILASAIKNHYSDPNFFNGEKDKIFHYFVSGSMTIDGHNNLPFLPSGAAAAIAGKGVLTLGWLKEVGSIPGNGYGADDMQANRIGIAAATANIKKYNK